MSDVCWDIVLLICGILKLCSWRLALTWYMYQIYFLIFHLYVAYFFLRSSITFLWTCSCHSRCGQIRCKIPWTLRKKVTVLSGIKILELQLIATHRYNFTAAFASSIDWLRYRPAHLHMVLISEWWYKNSLMIFQAGNGVPNYFSIFCICVVLRS